MSNGLVDQLAAIYHQMQVLSIDIHVSTSKQKAFVASYIVKIVVAMPLESLKSVKVHQMKYLANDKVSAYPQ